LCDISSSVAIVSLGLNGGGSDKKGAALRPGPATVTVVAVVTRIHFNTEDLMRRSLVVAGVVVLVASSVLAGDWRDKVDPWVLDHGRSATVEFLVMLDEQADLSPAQTLTSRVDKGRFVHQRLTEIAEATQGPVINELKRLGAEYRPYWIVNMIWVRASLAEVETMARRGDVAHVFANPRVALDVVPTKNAGEERRPEAREWNIALVNADDAWAEGATGTGVVVAGQDTGYLWTHPSIVNQYRGGPAGDHDYNWHDAIHSGGGSCGADSSVPCDDHGHGTHTMGTIVGDDGGTNQIGMAPDAQWIGCRNMDQGNGTPATYAECYQFFISPTRVDGSDPDPSKAPDVINNSWGCPPSEGCTDPTVLLGVVQAVRAAGIVTVHSAGNEGPSCSSVATPSAIYGESFSVGATDSSDTIASFSSRGPVTIDGSNRLKPDISAPGVGIRSADIPSGYTSKSGTSMAGPHVAGLVALVLSENPGIAGDVDLVEQIIIDTAVPLTTTQGCGGDSSDAVPNNVFGWGRIDALAAVTYPLDFTIVADPAEVSTCAPAEATVDITLESFQGFGESVTLSTNGLPTGATAGFSENPVTPPGSSVLTLGGTAAAGTGQYEFNVVGLSSPSSVEQQATVSLIIADGLPTLVTLDAPADAAAGVGLAPVFSWQPTAQAAAYVLDVASDAGFTTVVESVQVAATTATLELPLTPMTTYWWRVTPSNGCGDGPPSLVRSFTTRDTPALLLVDDDDNGPDVRGIYEATLNALGQEFDLWDTANTDNEPSAAELAPYRVVIWFTGDEFGGAAGPGSSGEAALDAWMAAGGRCLLISSQDYYWDRGLTTFMETRLGVSAATSDGGQESVTGQGAVFGGLGPYDLDYPFTDFSDALTQGPGGEVAFIGDAAPAGTLREIDGSSGVFLAFPFEALPDDESRQTVVQRLLDQCGASMLFADGFESGHLGAWTRSD
jgi:serine protease AprX